jgi:hypothetical protein
MGLKRGPEIILPGHPGVSCRPACKDNSSTEQIEFCGIMDFRCQQEHTA